LNHLIINSCFRYQMSTRVLDEKLERVPEL